MRVVRPFLMPETILIGPFTFDVLEMDDEMFATENVAGKIVYATRRIYVRVKGYSHEEVLDTLLHEVRHGIWYLAGLTLESDHEEENVIVRTNSHWIQVIRDNPELFNLIQDHFSTAERGTRL